MKWLEDILNSETEDKLSQIKQELPKNFIPKDKYNDIAERLRGKEEELKATTDKMNELSTQINTLSKSEEEKEKLKEQIEKLNNEFETFKGEADSRVINIKKKQAIEKGLRDANANPDTIDLLLSKFDLDTIELDEKDTVKEWDKHLTPIKEQRKSLFGQSRITGTAPHDGDPPNVSTFRSQYEIAMKAGNRLEAIKIKNQAFKEGEIL